jgi:CDP-paratose 2-epimerase
MLEAIDLCQDISGKKLSYSYADSNRIGDHIWYISDISKFKNHYPQWSYRYNLKDTLIEMHENMNHRF